MELISVSPSVLIFYAPYDRVQNRIVTFMNPTSTNILFKVKSNACRHYCVSPIVGCIKPYDIFEVNISLRYFDFHEDKEYKHRFCIETVAICEEPGTSKDMMSIFSSAERASIYVISVPVRLEPKGISVFSPSVKSPVCVRNVALELEQMRSHAMCPRQMQVCRYRSTLWYRLAATGFLMLAVGAGYWYSQPMHDLLMGFLFPNLVEPPVGAVPP